MTWGEWSAAWVERQEAHWQAIDRWLLVPVLRLAAAALLWFFADADFSRTQSLRDAAVLPSPLTFMPLDLAEHGARQLAKLAAILLALGLWTRFAAFLAVLLGSALTIALLLPVDLLSTAQVLPSLHREPAILPNLVFLLLLIVVLVRGGGWLSLDRLAQNQLDRHAQRGAPANGETLLLVLLLLASISWFAWPDWSLLLASMAIATWVLRSLLGAR